MTASRLFAALAASLISMMGLSVQAQTYGAPSCGSNSSDSSCYTAQSAGVCTLSPLPASQNNACPTGYFGRTKNTGMRDACTGSVTWDAPPAVLPGCTNCPNPLTVPEQVSVVSAILGDYEPANLAYTKQDLVCTSAYSCVDGTLYNVGGTPTTVGGVTTYVGGVNIGYTFRDHLYMNDDGFAGPSMPTTNRIDYLVTQNALPANLFPYNLLPKNPATNSPFTGTGAMYKFAIDLAYTSGTSSCSNNDMDHCDMACTPSANGFFTKFCQTTDVQFWNCSDSYAAFDTNLPASQPWQPTVDATVPYTSTTPAQDYTQKNWDWGTILGWNNAPSSGGTAYLCNSTINTCNGWVTDTYEYKCKTQQTYACSYVDANGATITGTCATCDINAGAVWDYQLVQSNDCPLVAGRSTRAAATSTRTIWLGDLTASSCPVNGAPPAAPAPPASSCPSGQFRDASGTCIPMASGGPAGGCVANGVGWSAPFIQGGPNTGTQYSFGIANLPATANGSTATVSSPGDQPNSMSMNSTATYLCQSGGWILQNAVINTPVPNAICGSATTYTPPATVPGGMACDTVAANQLVGPNSFTAGGFPATPYISGSSPLLADGASGSDGQFNATVLTNNFGLPTASATSCSNVFCSNGTLSIVWTDASVGGVATIAYSRVETISAPACPTYSTTWGAPVSNTGVLGSPLYSFGSATLPLASVGTTATLTSNGNQPSSASMSSTAHFTCKASGWVLSESTIP